MLPLGDYLTKLQSLHLSICVIALNNLIRMIQINQLSI